MTRIDAHQHFWEFDPVRDSWITDEMEVIQTDFLPPDLKPLLEKNNFDGCIVVQSDQTEKHNEFLLDLAAKNNFIKGLVGWVDLRGHNLKDRLAYYQQFHKLKGFRHVLQGEQDRAMMLQPAFMNGIAALHDFNFTYDILIYADQLQYIPQFVSAFPEQKFIIDHIAKPGIRQKQIEDWEKDMKAVAQYEQVYCKISGMVTEADWKAWTKDDFAPYLDVIVKAFGTNRIVYGSDWPVCLVAATYEKQLAIVQDYFSSFSADEQAAFFGGNAINFYHLK